MDWRRILVAAGCAALAVAAGCAGRPPAEAEGRNVRRPAMGFALDVPDGWTWRDLDGDVVLEIFRQETAAKPPAPGPAAATDAPPAERRARPVVHVVVIDRAGITPDTWADEAVASSRELQSDLEVTGREKATLADGREALALTLKNPRGLEPVVQRMLLAVTERRAYALLATAPETDMAAVGPQIETCFKTFVVW
ncbi:MAG: hypothetical protein IMZ66_07335 [Planctomycetes bacterium]|nr:hypothetical protein [Planctomycetota bacterium]